MLAAAEHLRRIFLRESIRQAEMLAIRNTPSFCLKNELNKGGVFIHNQIPVMNYPQYCRMRKLVHECCNYDGGNCILLDDGEECICVQSISYSPLCKWFRCAVLPLESESRLRNRNY